MKIFTAELKSSLPVFLADSTLVLAQKILFHEEAYRSVSTQTEMFDE
jgi:hypothetical protein